LVIDADRSGRPAAFISATAWIELKQFVSFGK
jgi:hypothetical protein